MGTFYRNSNNGTHAVYSPAAYAAVVKRREMKKSHGNVNGGGYVTTVSEAQLDAQAPYPNKGIATFKKVLHMPGAEPWFSNLEERAAIQQSVLCGDGRFTGTLVDLDRLISEGGHNLREDGNLSVPFSNNNDTVWFAERCYVQMPWDVERMFAPDSTPQEPTSIEDGSLI